MKTIAAYAYCTGATARFGINISAAALLLSLSGCSVLQAPTRPAVYDFGPGAVAVAVAADTPNPRATRLGPVLLTDVETTPALDTTAVLFRLNYADAQQLRPYAQARWSMPPAQLLRQRLRETLGQQRDVLSPGEGVAAGQGSVTLRIALEEFTQLFESETASAGLVRLRATVSQSAAASGTLAGSADRLLAQRSFVVQRPSNTADATGGVRALTAATDAAIAELAAWVQQNAVVPPAKGAGN
jgi:cholesterol transport system auxiliary component